MFRHPTHLFERYLELQSHIDHDFSRAVYYHGMPKELHMHSGQRSFLMSDDMRAVWISPNSDYYLFGVKIVVDDRLPEKATIDSIVKQSVEHETSR